MRKLKLVLEYQGHGFVGWQRQTMGLSIQQVVETALLRLTGEVTPVRAAGRTDAGVHALGQVVSFTTQSALPLHAFVHGSNAYLPESVAVIHAEEVPELFDARHSASGKLYRYQIWNAPVRSPLLARTHYHVRTPLDPDAMRAAAAALCGQHDFRAFRAADCERKTTVRLMRRMQVLASPKQAGTEILIEVEGTAFLKNMVRIFAGTLIYVGLGKMTAAAVHTLLRSGDRKQAGPTAPSHGLFLCRVDYGERTPLAAQSTLTTR